MALETKLEHIWLSIDEKDTDWYTTHFTGTLIEFREDGSIFAFREFNDGVGVGRNFLCDRNNKIIVDIYTDLNNFQAEGEAIDSSPSDTDPYFDF